MAEYCWPPSVLSKEMALHEEAQFKICTTCMLAQASVNTPKTAMSCDIKFNGQEIKSCWYCYCHGNKTNCNMAPLELIHKFNHVKQLRDQDHPDYANALNAFRHSLHAQQCNNKKVALAAARDEVVFLRAKLQEALGQKGKALEYSAIRQHTNECTTKDCLTCRQDDRKEPWDLDEEWVEVRKVGVMAKRSTKQK